MKPDTDARKCNRRPGGTANDLLLHLADESMGIMGLAVGLVNRRERI